MFTGGGGDDKVGGLVGEIWEYGNLKGNSATGTVSGNEGNDKVGGLVGLFNRKKPQVIRDQLWLLVMFLAMKVMTMWEA